MSGKYKSAIEVILAGIQLLEQQEDIDQGRLPELQRDAMLGWEASQRDEVVDGITAIEQIRANLRSCPITLNTVRLVVGVKHSGDN